MLGIYSYFILRLLIVYVYSYRPENGYSKVIPRKYYFTAQNQYWDLYDR